ncbi:MAG: DUF333 domain-containing protein [Anaerolineae bacterium]|nr:DUF333 domain-containing protein [Anaerolineae bacterium]
MYKKLSVLFLFLLVFLSACRNATGVTQSPASGGEETDAQIANPASENCIQQGGKLDIRKDADGEVGICVFPNGKECEEWALKRGECSPDDDKQAGVYRNGDYGFSLDYPSTWSLEEKAAGEKTPFTLLLKRDQVSLSIQVKRESEDKEFNAAAPQGGEISQEGAWKLSGQEAPLQVLRLEGKIRSASAVFTRDEFKIRCQVDDNAGSEIPADYLQEAARIVASLHW